MSKFILSIFGRKGQFKVIFGHFLFFFMIFLHNPLVLSINLVITIAVSCLIVIPEYLVQTNQGVFSFDIESFVFETDSHKRQDAINPGTIWEFDEYLKHSLAFYGQFGKGSVFMGWYKTVFAEKGLFAENDLL